MNRHHEEQQGQKKRILIVVVDRMKKLGREERDLRNYFLVILDNTTAFKFKGFCKHIVVIESN